MTGSEMRLILGARPYRWMGPTPVSDDSATSREEYMFTLEVTQSEFEELERQPSFMSQSKEFNEHFHKFNKTIGFDPDDLEKACSTNPILYMDIGENVYNVTSINGGDRVGPQLLTVTLSFDRVVEGILGAPNEESIQEWMGQTYLSLLIKATRGSLVDDVENEIVEFVTGLNPRIKPGRTATRMTTTSGRGKQKKQKMRRTAKRMRRNYTIDIK